MVAVVRIFHILDLLMRGLRRGDVCPLSRLLPARRVTIRAGREAFATSGCASVKPLKSLSFDR
jgi:hypothetical protein